MRNPLKLLKWWLNLKWTNFWKVKELKEYFKMVSVYRRTKHVPWVLGRIINASEDAIGVTARTKTHADALPMFKVSEGMNDFEVRISCNDTSTPLTGVARFYARRKNDDLCFLGSLAITTGDQVCGFSSVMLPTTPVKDPSSKVMLPAAASKEPVIVTKPI